MNLNRINHRTTAFTLIELLVVIAIMGILAAMIIGAAGYAARIKVEKRVKAELAQLETLIESYEAKVGFYPPDGTNDVALSPLFYELTGAKAGVEQPGNVVFFTTIKGDEKVYQEALIDVFGRRGIANSQEENLFTETLKNGQHREVQRGDDRVEVLVVPAAGPNDFPAVSGDPNQNPVNTWRYRQKGVKNPGKFDLWAEVIIAGKTKTFGNWKD